VSGANTPARPMIGIALVAFATLSFAACDVLTKDLAARHPVVVIAAIRYAINVGLLAVILGPSLGRALWSVNRRGLVVIRALCLVMATLTMGEALRYMPVGETVAIVYLAPFLVLILSMPLLGERVTLAGWVAASLGFLGVLLIAQPGSGLSQWGVLLALINACFGAVYHLLTRFLSRTETTIPLLWFVGLTGLVVFGVQSIPHVSTLTMSYWDALLLAGLGVFATLGHFLFTAAYRFAPAALLAPVNYVHLVWAGGLGWLVFNHVPAPTALIGMALVCLAGVSAASMAWFGRTRSIA
jgi:drug/metabolite transporter (DMT)-like permease